MQQRGHSVFFFASDIISYVVVNSLHMMKSHTCMGENFIALKKIIS